mgnify:CR=1 FL=1
MLTSKPSVASSAYNPASHFQSVTDRCEINAEVLKSLGVWFIEGRLAADFRPDSDPDTVEFFAFTPSSNTGGTYLVPEPIINLHPQQNYRQSTDWLTLSAPNIKMQFENFSDLYANVLRPLFSSMGVKLQIDSPDGPEDGYFIQPVESNGTKYYKNAYPIVRRILGPTGYLQEKLGIFQFGARSRQNHSLTLSISGAGCRSLGFAYGGLSARGLVEFLRSDNVCLNADLKQGKLNTSPWRITRLDAALDDYKSELGGLKAAYNQYLSGGFTTRGRTPDAELYGPAFHDYQADISATVKDKGSTLCLGSRKHSPKYCRIYEKQKERIHKGGVHPDIAAQVFPEMRYEVQFNHSGDYFIPIDALLCPLSLWAAAYPFFDSVASQILQDVVPLPLVRCVPDKLAVIKDSVSQGLVALRAKFGAFLRMAQQSGVSSNTIVQAVTNSFHDGLPTVWDMEPENQKPIAHETKRVFELFANNVFSFDVPF